jgi:quercetin 2,3-dioxygenase
MLKYRAASERGATRTSWLESFHSFSFNTYFDAEHVQFGPLRVLNDDYIAGGGGFPMHAHRDMEILTWVVEGTLEHRDSTGGHGIIRPGELQRMTAGRGVRHSEFNHTPHAALRLLQIWIEPDEVGLEPEYEQRSFDPAVWHNTFFELASGGNGEGQITINQDVRMFVARLENGAQLHRDILAGRGAYMFVINGVVTVNGQGAATGDAVMLENAHVLRIHADAEAKLLLFDVPLDDRPRG